MPDYCHLHNHSQYSLLDGASSIKGMIKKAKNDGMKAIALTDHGNMFGAFKFVAEANKNGIKPIVGCEFYLVEDRHKKQFTKERRDKRYHQLLLAKNKIGYRNLIKLCSLGYIEGLYSKWPRIDKELLEKYHEGLIATSCCIAADIPQAILFKGEEEAEKKLKWWLNLFGDDFYIELQRHNLGEIDNSGKTQEDVNQILLKWAKKYNVKVIATNDSHYLEEEDANAHDILLCINTGNLKSIPIGDQKGMRFGFPNNKFFFKTKREMEALFSDIPHALDNTIEIAEKVEALDLKRDILLPNYSLPQKFKSESEYLYHLSFNGAKKYFNNNVTNKVKQRLEYELKVIEEMGFAGYFLIVQDFINSAKQLNVSVGPGRGSAAGSLVAFCTGITNIDPIKYDLLFERFLNPERISMPDIDIDFDDDGRQKVIDYVVDKYGKNQVAQIITFGTMAAKMSIRDVARVLDLPLPEADRLAKLIPFSPGISLDKAFTDIKELGSIHQQNTLQGKTLQFAKKLEGSIRNTGIHAAGVIIAPDDLMNFIPVATSKDTDLLVTQFDGKVIEGAGMLKMDFLGLKTLSIIKDCIELVKINHGIDIEADKIPLDDKKTFELFQRGDTVAIFQFESNGMQTYLKELKPTDIEDLIAMAALYRPGPMDYIPSYIKRKHGEEEVKYPHELLKPILEKTFGIMVYQEQIMQAGQIIGGFSLGKSDILRRAMGKKEMSVMQQMKLEFIEGAKVKDINEEKASEIFDMMAKFANYGFNRSHSAAYSVLAFQTGYLKANFPAEFIAANLSRNMNDIKKVSFFMEESRRMNIKVLGPDVNESSHRFSVNKKGHVRFGLGAIKGVGEAAVNAILEERNNGFFKNIFDLTKRVNLSSVNKKTFEALALSGAFDEFPNCHRAIFFLKDNSESTFLEKAIKFGSSFQLVKNSSQQSLFGGVDDVTISEPLMPECPQWPSMTQLAKEKETIGMFISGHPLQDYKLEINTFCNIQINDFNQLENLVNKDVSFAGVVTGIEHKVSKRGKNYASFTIEDFSDAKRLALFGESYLKFKHFLIQDTFLLIKAKVQNRKYSEIQQIDINIYDIQLLDETIEKRCKQIIININLEDVNKNFLKELECLVKEFKGDKPFEIHVYDKKKRVDLALRSIKHKININKELIQKLNLISSINYKLN